MTLSFKERTRRQRESEILQHAIALIRNHPAHDLKLDDLADSVGISKPTLYQHFASKDDLVAHIMLLAYERFERDMNRLDITPLEQLQSALKWLLREKYQNGCSLTGTGGDIFARITQSHPAIIRRYQENLTKLQQTIEVARLEGQVDPFIPSEYVVGLLLSLVDLPMIATGTTPAQNQLDSTLELVVDLFTRAVAP